MELSARPASGTPEPDGIEQRRNKSIFCHIIQSSLSSTRKQRNQAVSFIHLSSSRNHVSSLGFSRLHFHFFGIFLGISYSFRISQKNARRTLEEQKYIQLVYKKKKHSRISHLPTVPCILKIGLTYTFFNIFFFPPQVLVLMSTI